MVDASATREIAAKIARLVEERGWNQEDLARIANINRVTVRNILQEPERRMRNATILACAKALGLSVHELRTLPLDRLLPRMHGQDLPLEQESLRKLYQKAIQPELIAWTDRNPDRARQLSPAEIDELLAVQGPDGPLSHGGMDRFVELLERKRELQRRVGVVAGSDYLGLLEQVVGLLYEKVQG